MLYWVFKWSLFVWSCRLFYRPTVTGIENIPSSGPAILVGNHISSGDTFLLPAMMRRRLTFPAKAEMFTGTDPRTKIVAWFLKNVGQVPMDRSGGRASATSMDSVLGVLRRGQLLGIFPEGTRSPDGRLHKGKTGVARLVLQAGVPVIPVGFVDTQWVKSRPLGIPIMRRPQLYIGEPLDFSAWAAGAGDRNVLRYVTDEIMAAVQQLSGQTYVDAYAASVKQAEIEGRELRAEVLARPGDGSPVPALPARPVRDRGPGDAEAVPDVTA